MTNADRSRFAAQNGKTTLYKFRSYQTPQDEWVRQIIEDHRIYFARASQLNDPFDMSPLVEQFTRETIVAEAERYLSGQPGMTTAERNRRLEYFRTCDLDAHAAKVTAKQRTRIEDDYSVFSLAGNRDHPMLWSHYADGHTGLCVHFRADADSFFGGSLRVIYDGKRALLPINQDVSDAEVFNRAVLHKGKFWSYEEEYRVLRCPDIDYSDIGIRYDGQHAFFPSSLVTGITVGIRMPPSNVEAVLRLAAAHTPRLTVWRAKEGRGFDLKFEEITS